MALICCSCFFSTMSELCCGSQCPRTCYVYYYVISVLFRNGEVEEVALSDALVNPSHEKVGPQHFNLLKVLGKGGYGKVSYFTHIYIHRKQLTFLHS